MIAGAARNRATSDVAVQYLSGTAPYSRLRDRVLSRNPGIVLALAADAVGRVWRSVRA